MKGVWRATWAGILLANVMGLSSAEPSQFNWERGESYVYRVRIEATEQEYKSRLTGNVVFTCRAANAHGFTLRCHNFLVLNRFTDSGRRFPPFGVFRLGWRHFDGGDVGMPLREPRDVMLKPTGALILQNGLVVIDPTDPSLLVIESMPPAGKEKWETTEKVSVTLEEPEKLAPADRRVLIHRQIVTADWTRRYEFVGTEGNKSRWKKQCIIEVPSSDSTKPKLRWEGNGTVVFENKSGTPRFVEMKTTLVEINGTTERTTPINIELELLEGKEREQALRPPPPPALAERRPHPDADIEKLAGELSIPQSHRRRIAADKLAHIEPNARRPEIVALLKLALLDFDEYTRLSAVHALMVWGGTESTLHLVASLADPKLNVRWAVLDSLAALRDPHSASALAEHLTSGKDSIPTIKALLAIGSPAEGALIPLLKNPKQEIRLEACRLIGAIGSAKSLDQIQKLAKDPDPSVAATARAAATAIAARKPR